MQSNVNLRSNGGTTMHEKVLYTPNELQDLIDKGGAVVIDIRDTEDYEENHIPGAVSIPDIFYYLAETTPDGLGELQEKFRGLFSAAGVSHDKKAIVYEDAYDTRYGGSCRGYWLLSYLGHRDVGILDGGFSAWTEAGLAVDNAAARPEPTDFVVDTRDDILATRDDVVACLNSSQTKLLDTRDRVEWVGESSSPYGVDFAPRKGRIPGARWIEWYSFLERTGEIPYFKTPEQIRAMCAEYGLYPDDDIILYCFKGARVSNTFVALKMAGFKNVRNYFGSWNEWSRDDSLPIHEGLLAA